MANERPNVVKMKGNPVTLLGNEVKVGDRAPDFTALAGLGAPVVLGDLEDSERVLRRSIRRAYKGNRLLARSIFVVDKNDRVRHAEIAGEITQEPNYEAALKAVRESI